MWCGRIDDTLVGHHITSYGASGDDSLDNMITLCGRCHGDVGNGYLDIRVCNHPRLTAMIIDGHVLGHSVSKRDWQLFNANDWLRKVKEL